MKALTYMALRWIDLQTERYRAALWARGNLVAFMMVTHAGFPRWFRSLVERVGRVCLRRSIRLTHRRAVRNIEIIRRDFRERALPPVLRPSEARR